MKVLIVNLKDSTYLGLIKKNSQTNNISFSLVDSIKIEGKVIGEIHFDITEIKSLELIDLDVNEYKKIVDRIEPIKG